MAHNSDYQSYLLRLWRADATQPWRASLQDTVSEEKLAFAEIETLFAFLLRRLQGEEEYTHTPTLAQSVNQSGED